MPGRLHLAELAQSWVTPRPGAVATELARLRACGTRPMVDRPAGAVRRHRQRHDKAEAMAAYARQAKDSELIQYATEIKVRAERRCGELLARTAATGERATQASHGRGIQLSVEASDTRPPTLADMGLTYDESSRYQQLAAMPTVLTHKRSDANIPLWIDSTGLLPL